MHLKLLLWIPALAASKKLIKGVSPSDQQLYVPDSNGMFACLSDPSIKIPFDRVNDDYCDCPDGSDEPGTAACSNGKFWCPGSEQYIPSRIVGDGACDYEVCCDGSDEAPGLCPDRCVEVKAAQAARREAALNFLREGDRIRNEMISQAQQRKQELQDLITEMAEKVSMTEQQLVTSESDLEVAKKEDQENSADPESVNAIAQLRDALRTAEGDISEVSDRFMRLKDSYRVLEHALQQMSIDYNPNFNDPAVKDAIKTWRDHPIPDTRLPRIHRDLISDIDLLDQIKIARPESSAVFGTQKSGGLSAFLKKLLPPLISEYIFSGHGSAAGNGVRTQKVQERIEMLQETLAETQQVLRSNEKLLALGEGFWGPNEIGHSIENECVSTQRGDFNYEACFFGTAVQIDGRYNVQLGHSTGLKESPDGQLSIEFIEGDRCPNGVLRSLIMNLECGHENEAFAIEEPDTCRYSMSVKSPMACKLAIDDSTKDSTVVHKEL